MTAVMEQRTSSVNRIAPDLFPEEDTPVFAAFIAITSSETAVTWSRGADTGATSSDADPCNGIIRWYDPITGRFLSNDPIGISGGLNQYAFCANNPVNFTDPYGLFQTGMFIRGLAGTVVSGVGAVVGAAAATTGVGSVPGGALALYSSYNFGANVGNIINSFRDVPAAPTGPIAGATVLATDNRTARNIAEATDLAIPFALSIGTSPVAWSRLPSVPVGPAGTLAGTLQRVPGDPSIIYPWIRGFQLGDAGLTAYDSWNWLWGGDVNSKSPCK